MHVYIQQAWPFRMDFEWQVAGKDIWHQEYADQLRLFLAAPNVLPLAGEALPVTNFRAFGDERPLKAFLSLRLKLECRGAWIRQRSAYRIPSRDLPLHSTS